MEALISGSMSCCRMQLLVVISVSLVYAHSYYSKCCSHSRLPMPWTKTFRTPEVIRISMIKSLRRAHHGCALYCASNTPGHDLYPSRLNNDNKLIATMSEKLAQLISSRIKDKKASTGESTVWKPLKLKFSIKHTEKIAMIDSMLAIRYLTLPIESYSVLDSSLVQRDPETVNVFNINIPLQTLSRGYTMTTGNLLQLPSKLQTKMSVRPPTDEASKLIIESDEIYFAYQNSSYSENVPQDNHTGTWSQGDAQYSSSTPNNIYNNTGTSSSSTCSPAPPPLAGVGWRGRGRGRENGWCCDFKP